MDTIISSLNRLNENSAIRIYDDLKQSVILIEASCL